MRNFPEEYTIVKENQPLHSGGTSNIIYDVNALMTNSTQKEKVISSTPTSDHYIGIASGGAIIAALVADRRKHPYSLIHDGELKGDVPEGKFLLIDDVTTTGSSFVEALEILSSRGIPRENVDLFVVVDRRAKTERNLTIESLFDVREIK